MERRSFADVVDQAMAMLLGYTSKMTEDGDMTDDELDQFQDELAAIIAGIGYERGCREEARQAAAGHAADKNRAEKVSTNATNAADYVNKLEI